MKTGLPLAFVLAASLASAAAAQEPPFWTGASKLRCDIAASGNCDGGSCQPFQIMRIVFVELDGKRVCASRDGATCAARYYAIDTLDQAGRLLIVVRGTGTSYSIAADGTMAGAAVVAPNSYVFRGRCARGG
jgi:hypothetical protein